MSDTESATSFSYSRPQSRNGMRQGNHHQSPLHNVSFSPIVTRPSEASGSTIKPLAARRQQQQQPQTVQDANMNSLRMPPNPRHQMSFSLLAKQDLKTANVFGIIHRSEPLYLSS